MEGSANLSADAKCLVLAVACLAVCPLFSNVPFFRSMGDGAVA
jgi:hypothetical protein